MSALLTNAQNAALASSEKPRSNAGARDRARSGDLVFFRHALYQLSYPGPSGFWVLDLRFWIDTALNLKSKI